MKSTEVGPETSSNSKKVAIADDELPESTSDIEESEDEESLPEPTLTDEDLYDTDLEIEDPSKKAYKSLSAEDIYVKSCEQLGVVPASYFIGHLQDEIMDMSHHGLGPNGIKAIATPLVINTSILDLNISDNWMTAEGMKDISEMLMENCYISSLDISCNKLGSEGARYINEMLQENSTLRTLNIARNDFRDNDAQYFEEAMRSNFKLKDLDISGNQFSESGGEWLGRAICSNEAIEYLNLSWNHLRLKGALAVCASMKSNITIKYLDLSWNGFADEGAMAMGEALKSNNTLIWLDLSHNRITERGATLLAKGLEVNDTLKTLKFGSNPLGSEGALALIKAVLKNDRSAIEELDLVDVRVDKEFLQLAEKLRERASLGGSKTSFNFAATTAGQPVDTAKERAAAAQDKMDPMMVLQKFLEDKRLRLVDLFRNFDKDLSWKISPEEFKRGILAAGIPYSKRQLKQLMGSLDTDSDGQVNYKELLAGRKQVLLRRREQRKRELAAKAQEKQEAERMMAIWQRAVKSTTPIPSREVSPSASPLRSRSLVQTDQPNSPNASHLVEHAAEKLRAAYGPQSNSLFASNTSFSPRDVSNVTSPRTSPRLMTSGAKKSSENVLSLFVPPKPIKSKKKKRRLLKKQVQPEEI